MLTCNFMKTKRYKDFTPYDIYKVQAYVNWKYKVANNPENKLTFEEYAEYPESTIPDIKDIERFENYYNVAQSANNPDYICFFEYLAQVDNVNEIHQWVKKNIHDGIEDEYEYHELTKENIIEFKNKMQTLKNSLQKLEYKGGYLSKVYFNEIPGLSYIKEEPMFTSMGNNSVIVVGKIASLALTINLLNSLLEKTDFKKEMIVYRADKFDLSIKLRPK